MSADELAIGTATPVEAVAASVPAAKATEFLRYFLMSVVALVLDFGTLELCVDVAGWDYRWGTVAGFLVGTVFAYAVSVAWIFRHRRFERWSAGLPRFAAVGAMGLLLNVALMMMFVEGLGLDHRWSKLLAAGLSFLFNFLVRRAWLFTQRRGLDVA